MSLPIDRPSSRLPHRSRSAPNTWSKDTAATNGSLRVIARYVVLPGGRRINVPADLPARLRRARCASAASSSAKQSARPRAEPQSGGKKFAAAPEPADALDVNGIAPGEAPQPLTLNHPALNPGRVKRPGFTLSGLAMPASLRSLRADDQIVAMNHFRAAAEAENRSDVRRRAAADFLRILGVIGAQPAADFGAVGAADDHRVAAREGAFDPTTPAGNRLLPRRSAATAPASMVSVPFGSSAPAIHFLRAVTGLAAVRNQVQRAPSAIARSGCSTRPEAMTMCVPALVAIRAASILVCMPPRDSSEPAAPAIASISGVTRATQGMCRAAALMPGGAS